MPSTFDTMVGKRKATNGNQLQPRTVGGKHELFLSLHPKMGVRKDDAASADAM